MLTESKTVFRSLDHSVMPAESKVLCSILPQELRCLHVQKNLSLIHNTLPSKMLSEEKWTAVSGLRK